MILNVNNFPPNEQTQNIVESINDSNLQMRDLEESSRNLDNVDIMHQSFVTTASPPTGMGGDSNFLQNKALL